MYTKQWFRLCDGCVACFLSDRPPRSPPDRASDRVVHSIHADASARPPPTAAAGRRGHGGQVRHRAALLGAARAQPRRHPLLPLRHRGLVHDPRQVPPEPRAQTEPARARKPNRRARAG